MPDQLSGLRGSDLRGAEGWEKRGDGELGHSRGEFDRRLATAELARQHRLATAELAAENAVAITAVAAAACSVVTAV